MCMWEVHLFTDNYFNHLVHLAEDPKSKETKTTGHDWNTSSQHFTSSFTAEKVWTENKTQPELLEGDFSSGSSHLQRSPQRANSHVLAIVHTRCPSWGNLGLNPQRLGSDVTTKLLQPITTKQRAGKRHVFLIWSLSRNVTFSARGSLPSQDADHLIIPFSSSHRLSNKHPASRLRGSRTD